MTTTYAISQTSTFSEARARAVMRHVLGDFMAAANAGLIDRTRITGWHEELEFAVVHNVVDSFELQLTMTDGRRAGLIYRVKDDGSILEESKSGGLDFHALPPGTRVNVVLAYRPGAQNIEKVRAYFKERGWTTGGTLLEGAASRERAFSKGGFGIERNRVGEW